jgi:hypothetical protein
MKTEAGSERTPISIILSFFCLETKGRNKEKFKASFDALFAN